MRSTEESEALKNARLGHSASGPVRSFSISLADRSDCLLAIGAPASTEQCVGVENSPN